MSRKRGAVAALAVTLAAGVPAARADHQWGCFKWPTSTVTFTRRSSRTSRRHPALARLVFRQTKNTSSPVSTGASFWYVLCILIGTPSTGPGWFTLDTDCYAPSGPVAAGS